MSIIEMIQDAKHRAIQELNVIPDRVYLSFENTSKVVDLYDTDDDEKKHISYTQLRVLDMEILPWSILTDNMIVTVKCDYSSDKILHVHYNDMKEDS